MITLSNKNNKENKQASNDQTKLDNLYEIAKEFSPILSTDAKSKIEEIAKEMGVNKEDVVLALESIVDPVSLYDPIFSDGGDTIYVMDQVGDKNDDKNWLAEIAIKEAIEKLGEREKTILSLRFFKGKTQMEVAQEIGISQAQVSRLEKGALDQIKSANK